MYTMHAHACGCSEGVHHAGCDESLRHDYQRMDLYGQDLYEYVRFPSLLTQAGPSLNSWTHQPNKQNNYLT